MKENSENPHSPQGLAQNLAPNINNNICISINNVAFEYSGATNRFAINHTSGTIINQSITALIGANGAGKTTLLQCIAGLLSPLSGQIKVLGLDTVENKRAVHQKLGYLPDVYGLYEDLSAEQAIWYAGRLQGLSADIAWAETARIIRLLKIEEQSKQKVGQLSHGQKQKVAIGQAVVHSPKVLLLDEPANGLDPIARAELAELLLIWQDSGMTIVVSSHILTELDQYASNMMLMDSGKIVDQQTIKSSTSAILDVIPMLVEWQCSEDENINTILKVHAIIKECALKYPQFKVAAIPQNSNNPNSIIITIPEVERADVLTKLIGAQINVLTYTRKNEDLLSRYQNMRKSL